MIHMGNTLEYTEDTQHQAQVAGMRDLVEAIYEQEDAENSQDLECNQTHQTVEIQMNKKETLLREWWLC